MQAATCTLQHCTLTSALDVKEERRRAPALRHHALALLRGLAGFLTILAADRERQSAQPALGDLLAALEAIAERSVVEAMQRLAR